MQAEKQTDRDAQIEGGYVLLARKLLKNGIMDRPPLFAKLWLWMLLQAFYKSHGDLERGQFFTTLEKMRIAMSYRAGYRLVKPSIKQIRGATKTLTKVHMIGTAKVTHGMVITILNYDFYQDPKNYEGHNGGQGRGHSEGTISIKKEKKKRKTSAFFSSLEELKKRYNQGLLNKVFEAIASTRKNGKVSDNILKVQLQRWSKFPVERVEAGIKIYLDRNYASEGKREDYLTGIIRRQSTGESTAPETSTGSPLLDRYYGISQ